MNPNINFRYLFQIDNIYSMFMFNVFCICCSLATIKIFEYYTPTTHSFLFQMENNFWTAKTSIEIIGSDPYFHSQLFEYFASQICSQPMEGNLGETRYFLQSHISK